ncbi:hypothetical protein GO009_10900 [Muricauda sp. TY007]|uniref:hypothetical protein n=1 Tax=Allomuricauda sp. TY007 TaxID=2683200 RepID=UPI0013C01FB5|nr:hypothetical protein [Muricauda sp. TY007]NDV16534.1 hypothetical protein [Muricauda sp. TY007]
MEKKWRVVKGDTVTVKVETRNLVDKTLVFNLWEEINWGFDRELSESISIAINDEGKGEATFTVPESWREYGDPNQVRKYYLKEKESGEEFPRAYYVKNPNKTDEENKKNSRRMEALMLKVTDNQTLDEATEKNSAVVLGEELPPPEKKTLEEGACPECGKKHVDLRNALTFESQAPGSSNCGSIARNIIKQLGINCEGSVNQEGKPVFYQLAMENKDHSELVFREGPSRLGLKYLDTALDRGYPVRVGVNHHLRKKKTRNRNINEYTTDHFVVVVGRKCVNGLINYVFWDVGSSRGASTEWVFELCDGYKLIANKTYRSDKAKYTVTQIARLIKGGTFIKILSIMLLVFLNSCTFNYKSKHPLENKTLIEVKEDGQGNLYNYQDCEVSALKYRFKNGRLYVLFHQDETNNMTIKKIERRYDTTVYHTDGYYNYTFGFYRLDSLRWSETRYHSILVDSLYAAKLPIRKRPCLECWDEEECEERIKNGDW